MKYITIKGTIYNDYIETEEGKRYYLDHNYNIRNFKLYALLKPTWKVEYDLIKLLFI